MMKETVIVEGKEDIRAVKAAVDCHVIATGGNRFGKQKLDEIRTAQERTGIIVLTDPDYAGGSIRAKIARAIPEARHAYLPRSQARSGDHAGVEYASPEAIRQALAAVRTDQEQRGNLTMSDLFALGLTGTPKAAALRRQVGRTLRIGEGNGRRFLERVNRYGISREELIRALRSLHGE